MGFSTNIFLIIEQLNLMEKALGIDRKEHDEYPQPPQPSWWKGANNG